MKPLLFIFIFALSLFISSCNSAPEETREYRDSISEAQQDSINQITLTEVSTEHLFRFFSSNFHLTGNLPCMYYDAKADEFVISGKKIIYTDQSRRSKRCAGFIP